MTTQNHAFAPEEIMAYLDSELSPDQMKAASQHLEQCSDCQSVAAEFQISSQKMSSWQIEGSPLEIPLPASIPFWKRGWAVATAAALVILILGLTVRSHSPRQMRALALQDAAPTTPPVERATAGLIGPLVVRTANLSLVANNFDNIRTQIEQITRQHNGYIGQLELNAENGAGRSLTASLRVPTAQLDPFIAQLKHLGRIRAESQSGEDVTQRSTDLDARLANLQLTEARLQRILQDRTASFPTCLKWSRRWTVHAAKSKAPKPNVSCSPARSPSPVCN
jgi:hypothetical protein